MILASFLMVGSLFLSDSIIPSYQYYQDENVIEGGDFLDSPYLTYSQFLRAQPGFIVSKAGLHYRGSRRSQP